VKLNDEYWQRVRARAAELGSDGCTSVSEWMQDCCLEHDVHCRTGMTLAGIPIDRFDADERFKQ